MKPLLMVSNAKTEVAAGKEIDAFSGPILRFNNYEISGYEHLVGTRTNFLAQRSCSDIKKRPLSELDFAFLFVTYCPLKAAMRSVANSYIKWYLDKAIVVDSEKCKETHIKCGYNERLHLDERKCSIGILAIDYFIGLGYTPFLYNFSYDTSHYFKKQPVDAKYHDFRIEAKLVQEWEKAGKLQFWQPNS